MRRSNYIAYVIHIKSAYQELCMMSLFDPKPIKYKVVSLSGYVDMSYGHSTREKSDLSTVQSIIS